MKTVIESGVIIDILNDGDGVLTIPAEAESVSETLLMAYAFDGVETIKVAEGNTDFSYTNGCLIHRDTRTLVLGLNQCTIPSDGSVEVIGACTFGYNATLDSLTIPEGILVIDVGAFSGSSIRKITLPKSLELVRGNAFGICEKLREITVLGENTVFEPAAFGKTLNDGSPMPRQISGYVHPDLVVKGHSGSCAEKCAEMNKIRFEDL